jgi:hypothetical protein
LRALRLGINPGGVDPSNKPYKAGPREEEVFMRDYAMELWAFMKEQKMFLFLPIILVLVFLGSLIVLIQVSSPAANQDQHQGEMTHEQSNAPLDHAVAELKRPATGR